MTKDHCTPDSHSLCAEERLISHSDLDSALWSSVLYPWPLMCLWCVCVWCVCVCKPAVYIGHLPLSHSSLICLLKKDPSPNLNLTNWLGWFARAPQHLTVSALPKRGLWDMSSELSCDVAAEDWNSDNHARGTSGLLTEPSVISSEWSHCHEHTGERWGEMSRRGEGMGGGKRGKKGI